MTFLPGQKKEGVGIFFHRQEGATRIFPRKDVFAWPEKVGVKKEAHDWRHMEEEERQFSSAAKFWTTKKRLALDFTGREKKARDQPHTVEDKRIFWENFQGTAEARNLEIRLFIIHLF